MTRGFAETITPVQGDILRAGLAEGPIALLFVDISKSAEVNDHILTTFFPALVPGSLVVQQDFLYFRSPWLWPTMLRLEGAMPMLGHAEENAVIFGVRRAHPEEIEACLARTSARAIARGDRALPPALPAVRQLEMIDALEAAFPRPAGRRQGLGVPQRAGMPAAAED